MICGKKLNFGMTDMTEERAPLKLFGCTLVEMIMDEAPKFFGDKPIDAIAFNAYVQGASAMQAAQMIVISNRETIIAAERLVEKAKPDAS